MSVELAALWRLYELDEQGAQVHQRLRAIPEQRTQLESRVNAERARLAAHQKTTADAQLVRRKLEQEIEAVTTQQRTFESRQPVVKTNEEYQALTAEIAGCKAKRSDLETRVLMQFEEEERIAGEKKTIEKALATAEAELAARRGALDRDEAEERQRLADLESKRVTEMAMLSAATRSRYERVHASREGRAVVPILKNACGGCFRQQTPQMLQEARRGERWITCDGCGRMLVWPPEGVTAPE